MKVKGAADMQMCIQPRPISVPFITLREGQKARTSWVVASVDLSLAFDPVAKNQLRAKLGAVSVDSGYWCSHHQTSASRRVRNSGPFPSPRESPVQRCSHPSIPFFSICSLITSQGSQTEDPPTDVLGLTTQCFGKLLLSCQYQKLGRVHRKNTPLGFS